MWGRIKYGLININIINININIININNLCLASLWIFNVGKMAIIQTKQNNPNKNKIWEFVYSLQTLLSMSTACYFSTFSIWTFERQLHIGN